MYQIINSQSYKNNYTIALTLEQAEQNVIKIYLLNEMESFYAIDNKKYNFNYEKLLILKDVNKLVIDKEYSKACSLILKNFPQLSIVDLNNFTPPEPLDQKEIEESIKVCVFDGFKKSQLEDLLQCNGGVSSQQSQQNLQNLIQQLHNVQLQKGK